MEFSEKKILLKDGREAVIRSAQPGDAAEMAAFMKTTPGKRNFCCATRRNAPWTRRGRRRSSMTF